MPYSVEIASTPANDKFIKSIPKEILPNLTVKLQLLGEKPFLGRWVEAPIQAFIYNFSITHCNQNYNFAASYKVNENSNIIIITNMGYSIIEKG